MSWSRVRGIERGGLHDRLRDRRNGVGVEYLALPLLVKFTLVPSTYPACIWIQKPPPYTVLADLGHASTSVKEDGKHALSKIDNL